MCATVHIYIHTQGETQTGMSQCSTSTFEDSDSGDCAVLNTLESMEMTEQTEWRAKQPSQMACISTDGLKCWGAWDTTSGHGSRHNDVRLPSLLWQQFGVSAFRCRLMLGTKRKVVWMNFRLTVQSTVITTKTVCRCSFRVLSCTVPLRGTGETLNQQLCVNQRLCVT